jgi:hypothetical protein
MHQNTSGYQVKFSPAFLSATPFKLPYFIISSKPYLALGPGEFTLLKQELELLKNVFDQQDVFTDQVIRQRLQIILTLLHRWYAKTNPGAINESSNRLIVRFFNFLENHFQD